MINAISYLPPLKAGRTFVCGDIHGCFSLLEDKLKDVHFDASVDRVICVGDLIDRGPESVRALEFLAYSWFHSVMGNHERMLLDVLSGDLSMEAVWLQDGGAWFYEQVPKVEWDTWKDKFLHLPILIEIKTETGCIGIVHADIPRGVTWKQYTSLLQKNDLIALNRALKSRFRVNSRLDEFVSGVDRIYCGHTYVSEARLLGNVCCIDTGAYLGEGKGYLTLMEITDDVNP